MAGETAGTWGEVMALTARLLGDASREGREGMTPEMAASVRPSSEDESRDVEAVRGQLRQRLTGERDSGEWALDDVAMAALRRSWALPRPISSLEGGGASGRLGTLAVALVGCGAHGEPWAVRLVTAGAALVQRFEVSARMAPALVWVASALRDDVALLERLLLSWPPPLRAAARAAQRVVEREPRTDAAVVRSRLEEVLDGDG